MGEPVRRARGATKARERGAILDAVLANTPTQLYLYDREGRYLYVSEAGARVFGLRPEDIVGRTWEQLGFPSEIQQDFPLQLESVFRSGRPLTAEGVFQNALGRRAYEYTLSPIHGDAGGVEVVVGTVTDVTQRRCAEQALAEAHHFLESILEQAASPILVCDAEGRISFANAATRGTGLTDPRGSCLADDLADWARGWEEDGRAVPPQEWPLSRALRGETISAHHGRFHGPDGTVRDFLVSAAALRGTDGRIQGAVAAAVDVTREKRAEAELRRTAQRLRVLREVAEAILAEQAPEAIATAALRGVRALVPCLRASVVQFDLGAGVATRLAVLADGETALGPGTRVFVGDLLPAPDLAGGACRETDLARAGPSSPVFRELLAEGARGVLSVPLITQGELVGSLNVIVGQPGPFAPETVEIVREVAEPLAIALHQRKLDRALQRHAEALEQRVAERTAELQAFVRSVTHDLRAPLRAMGGFAAALLEDCERALDPVARGYAERIAAAADRMGALINDLLAYSLLGRDDIALQPVSLAQAVAGAQRQLAAPIAETGACIAVEAPLPEVLGHHAVLVQVLVNLLSNAIKFAKPGTLPRVRVWAEREEARVRLWVEDDGIGVAPEHHERIFAVFERLHGAESYPGTGIGLAIVRRGAARMGGEAGVESEPGKGSRFWLLLSPA